MDKPTETVELIGSGIDPYDHATADSGRELYATDPMMQRIGEFPELPEPTADPIALVEAYEAWISRYPDLSMGMVAAWIDRWAAASQLHSHARTVAGRGRHEGHSRHRRRLSAVPGQADKP